jgi:iron only hydrogenase large subunit-like protein
LLQQHSVTEFLALFDGQNKIVVAISPQSLASVAAFYETSTTIAFERLQKMFMELGCVSFISLGGFIDLSLDMAYDEFLHRNNKTVLCSECPGWVCYAEKTIGEVIVPHMSVVKSPQ